MSEMKPEELLQDTPYAGPYSDSPVIPSDKKVFAPVFGEPDYDEPLTVVPE